MPIDQKYFDESERVVALLERFYLDLGAAKGANPCYFNPEGGKSLEALQDATMFNLKRYKQAVEAAHADNERFYETHPNCCRDCGADKTSIRHLTGCDGESVESIKLKDEYTATGTVPKRPLVPHICDPHCRGIFHCRTTNAHTVSTQLGTDGTRVIHQCHKRCTLTPDCPQGAPKEVAT